MSKTRTYTVTGSLEVLAKFERFMAMLHHNSRVGHSATFGMSMDGDGAGEFTVEPEPAPVVITELRGFKRKGLRSVECAGVAGFYYVPVK